MCQKRKERGRKRATEFICGGEIRCVKRRPTPVKSNFDIYELWDDIFYQTKPSMGGYGGIDYAGVREVLSILGVELDENLYRRINYVEGLYIEYSNKKEEEADGS